MIEIEKKKGGIGSHQKPLLETHNWPIPRAIGNVLGIIGNREFNFISQVWLAREGKEEFHKDKISYAETFSNLIITFNTIQVLVRFYSLVRWKNQFFRGRLFSASAWTNGDWNRIQQECLPPDEV
ncbi:hypothetical protein B9Z55_022160 [Caenorhabditis nigoni]|uniref:Uncharacterized protein n=1 Tax=Caenorhabditis nigoni TaxID=1611254 RepID=A0A2G5TV85_9PELO|nr:hypothetical protein B9Z55_022160 [Caenorhabditis nigoni]